MTGIIFEGPDAAGKSTLAARVSQASGRQMYRAGGAPKDTSEMWRMIDEQSEALERGMLVDRVSAISQQVYRDGLWQSPDLVRVVMGYFSRGAIMVYCRPPLNILLDPNKHEWKEYDTPEWRETVLRKQETYVDRYDRLMSQMPCIIYDWTSEESTHIENLLMEIDTKGVYSGLRDMMLNRGRA